MFNICVLLVLFYIWQFIAFIFVYLLGGAVMRCVVANSCCSSNQNDCCLWLSFRFHHPYFNQGHGELYHIFFLIFNFILKVLFSWIFQITFLFLLLILNTFFKRLTCYFSWNLLNLNHFHLFLSITWR